MSDYSERRISQAGGDGEPGTGAVAFHKLSKPQLLTLAIALQDQRDRALALIREQAAKLDRLEELATGWKPPRENADLDDTQVWYSFAKHHAAQAIRNIVRGL